MYEIKFKILQNIKVLKYLASNIEHIIIMKIIFLGDIVGKIGRKAIKEALPKLKRKYKPDLVIANAENLAHGSGVTNKTLKEMMNSGIDFFTSGNHIWDNPEAEEIFNSNDIPIIRPANYPPNITGDGYKIIDVGTKKILIANLIGRVFIKENFDCPFRTMEKILIENNIKDIDAIIIDFHAEATSEKITFGHYFDEQTNLIVGTHTHIQTADEQILPKGTAYITDTGMNGAKHSSLGVDLKPITHTFLNQIPMKFEIPTSGICQINGIFATIKENNKAQKIERINFDIEI